MTVSIEHRCSKSFHDLSSYCLFTKGILLLAKMYPMIRASLNISMTHSKFLKRTLKKQLIERIIWSDISMKFMKIQEIKSNARCAKWLPILVSPGEELLLTSLPATL